MYSEGTAQKQTIIFASVLHVLVSLLFLAQLAPPKYSNFIWLPTEGLTPTTLLCFMKRKQHKLKTLTCRLCRVRTACACVLWHVMSGFLAVSIAFRVGTWHCRVNFLYNGVPPPLLYNNSSIRSNKCSWPTIASHTVASHIAASR